MAVLLEDNSQLPEKDRLDRREFELDVDEQTRRLAQGEDKVADLKTDLKAWNIARREVAMSVKGDVWDKMEVQGRSLKGVFSNTVVYNFPMMPMTDDEETKLVNTKQVGILMMMMMVILMMI